MINQFYVIFENKEYNAYTIKHIQYNLLKRLAKIKYVTYRRINILLTDKKEIENIQIKPDYMTISDIKCYIDPLTASDLNNKKNIASIYSTVFNCLEVLWTRNSWSVEDLKNMHNDIENENFYSAMVWGKTLVSPDKKYKAEFLCELFPDYTDYYLHIFRKKDETVQKVKFLRGQQDPSSFFGFFPNQNWRDNEYFLQSNHTKEIFYIFNVNSDSFSIEYRPGENSLEECKNYVAAFQANLTQNERLILLGMPPIRN